MEPENDLTPKGTEQVPQEPGETTPPATPPVDPANDGNAVEYWKNKATAQAKENIVLHDQIGQLRDARKELTNEPTDSELQAAFPEWEVMTDTEKKIARRTFAAERIVSNLQQKDQEREAQGRWNTDLELFSAANPSLQGKEQAFKAYANKPTHRGADLETLRKAFLYESSSPAPAATPASTSAAPGLLQGNGGPRGTEKPKLMTGVELKTLRETDMKAYREYISTHDVTDLEA